MPLVNARFAAIDSAGLTSGRSAAPRRRRDPQKASARVSVPSAASNQSRSAAAPSASRALARALPAAGRQVDLPPRLHLRPPRLRRDRSRGAARGRRRPRGPAGLARRWALRSSGSAPGRWRIRGPGIGALAPPAGTLDFGNAGTGSRLMMGVVGSHGVTATFDGDASLRKRPMSRILDPLRIMGAEVLSRGRGRALSHRAQGRPRSRAHSLSHAGRLGADQVRRAACRPQRPRHDNRDRGGGLARSYRKNAGAFRRRGDVERRRPRPADRSRRPPGARAEAGRRSGGPLVGRISCRRRADRCPIRTSSSRA